MEIAIPGLMPASFAAGDSRTAQRHLGAVRINALTLAQHGGGALAPGFLAASKQGLKLAAASSTGVYPHSPAAVATSKQSSEANRKTIKAVKLVLIVEPSINWLVIKGLGLDGVSGGLAS